MTDRELVEKARAWPAAEQGDALSAGFVGELLSAMADRIEALGSTQPDGVERVARAIARHSGQGHDHDWENFVPEARAAIAAGVGSTQEDDETYEIGKRDGYNEAVQDIDMLTGGDGEYRYVMGVASDAHCPDAEAMKRRIVERFGSTLMREALEPFAAIGDKLLEVNGWADDDKITVDLSNSFDVLERLPVSLFRKARAALAQGGSTRSDGKDAQ